MHITCPSGLQVEIEELRTKTIDELARDNSASGYEKALVACASKVLDPGPYDLSQDGTMEWRKGLVGDRLYTLLQIRKLSFGPMYAFEMRCPDRACRTRFEYEFDLDDLRVQRLREEDAASLAEHGYIKESVEKIGGDVKFRLLTGADEKKMVQLKKKSGQNFEPVITTLLLRIKEIDGVKKEGLRKYLRDLPWSTTAAIQQAMERHDCGVDTAVEIECPSCGYEEVTDLPLGPSFLLPKRS